MQKHFLNEWVPEAWPPLIAWPVVRRGPTAAFANELIGDRSLARVPRMNSLRSNDIWRSQRSPSPAFAAHEVSFRNRVRKAQGGI
jgi:hypothetical protein